ncbi:MAG: alanine racemase [Anaerolineae bacterium]
MIYLSDILAATGGRVYGPIFAQEFSDFCFDSRILQPGELFLAVKTEKGDGHDYIEEACRDGATGVLCEREIDLAPHRVTCVVVPDTQQALRHWGEYITKEYAPEVIGVTGSTGKTSAKEAIAKVLEKRFPVFRNHANYNGRYGLPIALGRLRPEHKIAVLEMACDSFKEIEELAQMTSPRIGVVMSVNAAHLEYLGSLENIAREKGRLIEALPEEGYALLNFDDPRVRAMAGRTKARVLTFGTNPKADLYAYEIAAHREGVRFIVRYQGEGVEVRLALLGAHSVYTALAAMGVGTLYGLSLQEAAQSLEELKPLMGRLKPLEGINGSLLLDDSYSANPTSTLAALDLLAQMEGEDRVAILGDMLQLGAYEEEGHREVGRRAAQVVDYLVTKGERAGIIADEARGHGLAEERIFVTYTVDDALRSIAERVGPGDLILVKGSMEARMERVVEKLLADPSQAESLLVRQSPAWKRIHIIAPDRPTWVEIDLGALAHNVREIKRIVGEKVGIIVTLKADAYGHGAVKVARTALANGATMLGVACLGEAVALRKAGISAPIIILGYTPAWQARDIVLHDITATVFSLDVARAFSRAAVALNSQVRVHIKVDTGMGRLGLLPSDLLPFVQVLQGLPNLLVEGIFTHFAIADVEDAHGIPGWGKEYTLRQLETFKGVVRELEASEIHIPLIHAAHSAAVFTLPESYFNLVRPGIAVYGLDPSSEVRCPDSFRPVLSFKTQIAQVKRLPKGSYISYGCAYRTERSSSIAVIPVGYADGFRRGPRIWGEVLVRGQRAPVVGRVCMDMSMIDVTDIPGVRQGDEVVLIGQQGEERITAEEVADKLGTINYEVVSEILARVPRVS